MANRTTFRLSAALLLTALFGAGAGAQEFCVMCTGPEASYRCLIGGDAPAALRTSRGQFLCITELARSGGHQSCSASRAQATPCPGETRTVALPAGELGDVPPEVTVVEPPPPPQAHEPAVAPVPLAPEEEQYAANGSDAVPAEPAEPNAIEDLAKKTGKAVEDTGKAVGGAVKKTWDCVTSLFGDC